MPPEAPPPTEIRLDADEIPVAWSVHLLHRHPAKAWAIGTVAVLSGAVGAWALGSWLGAVLGLGVIFGSTAEYLLPQRFMLTSVGAMAAVGLSRSELAWPNVRRIVVQGDTVLLSPLPAASRLDAFRGVRLCFDPSDGGIRAAAMDSLRLHAPGVLFGD